MQIDHQRRWTSRRALGSLGALLALAAMAAPAVLAKAAAPPRNTSLPSISGRPREGGTLTAENGNWSNTPTSFTYQWQRCDTGGAGCAAISNATSKTYTVAAADTGNTLRVVVTAVNADGSNPATSNASALVSSSKAPVSTVAPSISGTARPGEEFSASNGTWTGGVQSYSYQWQRCDTAGASCATIVDADSRIYGVRNIDIGRTLRVIVTAKNASGSTNATSGPSPVVRATASAPPVLQNRAPTIAFISLRLVGVRVYARFRTCDDSPRSLVVVARDRKASIAPATHRFAVPPPCGTRSRNWVLPARFRDSGRYVATLRALDRSGRWSRSVSRALRFG